MHLPDGLIIFVSGRKWRDAHDLGLRTRALVADYLSRLNYSMAERFRRVPPEFIELLGARKEDTAFQRLFDAALLLVFLLVSILQCRGK